MRSLVALVTAGAIPQFVMDVPESAALIFWGAALFFWGTRLRKRTQAKPEVAAEPTSSSSIAAVSGALAQTARS